MNTRKYSCLAIACLFFVNSYSQEIKTRPITADEYSKAKTFTVADLDKDSYVKIEGKYILDRYEMKKPYFITGDDGMKKRIDLYKLVSKDSLQELGTLIFYTNEKGKLYTACLPGVTATPKVWEQYFEDIHAIDKEEKNYVLKLSYVLSKEFSFQQYKAMNQGKNMKEESATYGNEICFPGTDEIAMADGSKKPLSAIQPNDAVLTVDPVTHTSMAVKVQELVVHEAKNYAITTLLLVRATEKITAQGITVSLSQKQLEATPNHPVLTSKGIVATGAVKEGDEILCSDAQSKKYTPYTVMQITESGKGSQPVYNIVAAQGSTFIMNGVMVMQKQAAAGK